jgi:hypothetical protein
VPGRPSTHRALRFTAKLQRQRTRSRAAETALAAEIREKRETHRRLLADETTARSNTRPLGGVDLLNPQGGTNG